MSDSKFHTEEFYTLKAKHDALDRLFDQKHRDLQAYLEAKLNGISIATEKALDASNKRLEGMNEFRDALKDQASTFITRAEYDRTREDIKNMEISAATLAGKASQKSVNLALVISVTSGLIGILALLFEIFKYYNNHLGQ